MVKNHADYDNFIKQPCFWCGRTMRPPQAYPDGVSLPDDAFTRDHIYPRRQVRGRRKNKSCIVPCCNRCNRGRRDTDFFEFGMWLIVRKIADEHRVLRKLEKNYVRMLRKLANGDWDEIKVYRGQLD